MNIVLPLSAFDDNYIWLIVAPDSRHSAVVDPGDAAPVLTFLEDNHITLSSILITHHHHDHTGGLAQLKKHFSNLPVFGPKGSHIEGITHYVGQGDTVTPPHLEAQYQILEVPGHTLDHIVYYNAHHLFCGDTLFSSGCGRLFEGSAKQMHNSLEKLKQLDEKLRVYCAHEYTLANLEFARKVEPDNLDVQKKWDWAVKKRSKGEPTLPSTLQDEKKTNPFLRAHCQQVKNSALNFDSSIDIHQPEEVFATIRAWKDLG